MPESANISKKMSDARIEPETVTSTVPAEQSPKNKKGKEKISKNSRRILSKSIPVQDGNQEVGSESFNQKEVNLVPNLKDFPQLVRKDHETSQFQKCWRSYVSGKGNGNGSDETFPAVPYVGSSKKKKNNLSKKIIEQETPSCKEEYPDRQDISSPSKNEKRVKPDHSNTKPKQPKEKTQTQRNPMKKKRADPVLINLNEILEVNKAQKKSKQQKVHKGKSHRFDNTEKLSGNILDSSNPKRNRGKHREIKRKKLTNLKLVILKERIIKQKLKESPADGNLEDLYDDLIENLNFKEEIKKYLKELEEKKIKMKESVKDKGQEIVHTDVKIKEMDEELIIESKDELHELGCLEEKNNYSLENLNEGSVSKTEERKEILFSCKMREYCENIITPELNIAVTELIKEVANLQDKFFARDPIKAKAKRRHVSGFREVKKFLNLKKVKMIIIPPNLEKLQMKGSVFDLIKELKEMANAQNVPYVFALDRYKIGKCTRKNVPVGAFAILNYEGLEDRFKKVLSLLREARQQFADIMTTTTAQTKGENIAEDEQQTGDTLLKEMIKDEKESNDENSDEEDISQTISSFLTSLRELSTKK